MSWGLFSIEDARYLTGHGHFSFTIPAVLVPFLWIFEGSGKIETASGLFNLERRARSNSPPQAQKGAEGTQRGKAFEKSSSLCESLCPLR
jgi:hypothetical protein